MMSPVNIMRSHFMLLVLYRKEILSMCTWFNHASPLKAEQFLQLAVERCALLAWKEIPICVLDCPGFLCVKDSGANSRAESGLVLQLQAINCATNQVTVWKKSQNLRWGHIPSDTLEVSLVRPWAEAEAKNVPDSWLTEAMRAQICIVVTSECMVICYAATENYK